MTADQWTRVVRQQLGLGRLLPLGGARGGAWLAESAARTALRRETEGLTEVRIDALRVGPLEGAPAQQPAVPAPPSALRPGPLRITADFSASGAQPLPLSAALLRSALSVASDTRLGLDVRQVDLRITGLLDPSTATVQDDRAPGTQPAAHEGAGRAPGVSDDESRVRRAAEGVPGVARLTGALGGFGRAVHMTGAGSSTAALNRRHVRVELAVERGPRVLDVATAVRRAVAGALPDDPTVAVVVTWID